MKAKARYNDEGVSSILAAAILALVVVTAGGAYMMMGFDSENEIIPISVTVDAGSDISAFVNTPVMLNAMLNQTPNDPNHYNYSWIFGDGSTSAILDSTSAVSHVYTSAGTYAARIDVLAPNGTIAAQDETSVIINCPPALTIEKTKTSGPDQVQLYEYAEWQLKIKVSNTGGSTAHQVEVHDVIPGEWDLLVTSATVGTTATEQTGAAWHLTWTIGDLEPAMSAELTMSLCSGTNGAGKTEPTTSGWYVLNEGATAEYQNPEDGSETVIIGPTDPIWIEAVDGPRAELAITKTFIGNSTPLVRTPWQGMFYVNVTHVGETLSSPTFETTCVDIFPADLAISSIMPQTGVVTMGNGSFSWAIGTLDPGDTACLTFNASKSWEIPGNHTINFGATAAGKDLSDNIIEAGPTGEIIIQAFELPAGLDIAKSLISGDLSLEVNTSETWTFEVVVANPTGTSSGDIYNTTVFDTLPNGLTCNHWTLTKGTVSINDGTIVWNVGTLPGGESAVMTFDADTAGWENPNTYLIQPGAWALCVNGEGEPLTAGPTDALSCLVWSLCGPELPPEDNDSEIIIAVKTVEHTGVPLFANLIPGQDEPDPIELELFPELLQNGSVRVTSSGPAGEEVLIPAFIFFTYNTALELNLKLTVSKLQVTSGQLLEQPHVTAVYLNSNGEYPVWEPTGIGDLNTYQVPKGAPSRVLVTLHAKLWASYGEVAKLDFELIESVSPVEDPIWPVNTDQKPSGWTDLYDTPINGTFIKPIVILPEKNANDSLASGIDQCKNSILDIPEMTYEQWYIDNGGIYTEISASSAVEWNLDVFNGWWGSNGAATWFLKLESVLLFQCQLHTLEIDLTVNGLTTTHALVGIGQEMAIDLQGPTTVTVSIRFCIWGAEGAWAGIGLVDGWAPLSNTQGASLDIATGSCVPSDFEKQLVIQPVHAIGNLMVNDPMPVLPPPVYSNITNDGNIVGTYSNVRSSENYSVELFRPWASCEATVNIWIKELSSGSSEFLSFRIQIVRGGVTLDSLDLQQILAGDYELTYTHNPVLGTASVWVDFCLFEWDDPIMQAHLVLGESFGPPPTNSGEMPYIPPMN